MSDNVALYLSAKAAAFSIESILSGKTPTNSELNHVRSKGRKRKRHHGLPLSSGTQHLKSKESKLCPVTKKCCALNNSNGIRIELQHQQLWEKFHALGTEMIITKVGRRMFPTIRVKISGLMPHQKYYVMMDIASVDDKRYRYAYHSSQWFLSGDSDVLPSGQNRVYVHPDSPLTGEQWQKQILAFDKIKLTNNDQDENGHIILQSMKKYQPRIHIIQSNGMTRLQAKQLIEAQPSDHEDGLITTFVFSETQFITVTAYQNQQITKLKIDRNPFAKGFRDLHRYRDTDDAIESNPVALVSCSRKLTEQRHDPVRKSTQHEISDHPVSSPLVCLPHCISPCSMYHGSGTHEWFHSDHSCGKRFRYHNHVDSPLPWSSICNQPAVIYSSIERR